MLTIEKKLVPNHGTRGSHRPIAIVDHISIGTIGSVYNTFNNPVNGVSSHFCVGRDGSIEQFVELTRRAHTNGFVRSPKSPLVKQMGDVNANYYTVTIEHEGYEGHGKDGSLTEEQFAATCWLHKWIQGEVKRIYGNTIALNSHQVIAHNQIDSQKGTCPGVNYPWARLYTELAIADRMDFDAYEERLESLNGDSSKRAVSYAIAERVQELGERLTHPKHGQSANMKLEWLRPIVVSVGYYINEDKTEDRTVIGIAKRVVQLYNTAKSNGQYTKEGIRKLLLFEPIMREKGLLP